MEFTNDPVISNFGCQSISISLDNAYGMALLCEALWCCLRWVSVANVVSFAIQSAKSMTCKIHPTSVRDGQGGTVSVVSDGFSCVVLSSRDCCLIIPETVP